MHENNIENNNPSEEFLKKAEEAREIKHRHQKNINKRRYAKRFRESYLKKNGKLPGTVKEKILYKLKESIAVKKAALIGTGITAVIAIITMTAVSSCGAIFTDALSTAATGSYQSKPSDIDGADLQLTEKEMQLQDEIDKVEDTHPGYDEYEYNIAPIGHDPFTLISYLSAKHTVFTSDDVQGDIDSIYNRMYDLSFSEREETRTRTVTKTDQRAIYDEESGLVTGFEDYEYEAEEEYTVRILSTTLQKRDLENIASADLNAEDKDLYDTYQTTKGLLQYFYTPLALNWQSYIKSYYGYRKNAQTGDLEFHKGLDIAVPEGTEVLSAQDGTVTEASYDSHYGNYIVIEDDKGYMSKYAHLQNTAVSTGQQIWHGDIIGHTGSTGSATGSELHIECLYRGDHYDPLFYFENGEGSLYATDPDSGEYIPVEASGDAAAIIEEAMKYRNYPYRWGGSSPETSFDCSGFVSWCINASGYADVGRQTAQGLYNISSTISQGNAQPGDLIFFTGTYNSGGPVSHVGIYLGNGQMIHAGDPIKITNINTSYWQSHFYSYGRI